MESGKHSPVVANHLPWPLLNSVPRRLKALWAFLLLFHLLSCIFIIALFIFIHNTTTQRYGTTGNGSDNIDLILASFPFPPPETSPYPFHSVNLHDHDASNLTKRWGHFDRLPTTEKCYRQERMAALISLFGGGVLGADQLYAGNLRFGLPRLLLQVLCCGSLVAAGVYSIVTASKTRAKTIPILVCSLVGLIQFGVWIWATVDLARWIIGGYYGTKGCPV